MAMGVSAGGERSSVDLFGIWALCNEERKAGNSSCTCVRNRFVKELNEAQKKPSTIEKIREMYATYIADLDEIVKEREVNFTRNISIYYTEGRCDNADSLLDSFAQISMLGTQVIKAEMNKIKLDHEIDLLNQLTHQISSKRSVIEEKNQAKVDRVKEIRNLRKKAAKQLSFVTQKLEIFSILRSNTGVSKKTIDQLETEMNLSVMNAESYRKKIEAEKGNLKQTQDLLAKAILTLTTQSETFNSAVKGYFEMNEKGNEGKEINTAEEELIGALEEFEQTSRFIGEANKLSKRVESHLKNLEGVARIKSGNIPSDI